MKPRTEKKLSKKLAEILKSVKGFTPKDVWIDDDLELYPKHYAYENKKPLTSRQKRANYQQRVRVNNMPSIGGGIDYWGEGQDWHSVYYCAQDMLAWTMFPIEPYCPHTDKGGYPRINIPLNGKNIIALAKEYAALAATKTQLKSA